MKQVFVPELQKVFNVYGVVQHDGEIYFIVWMDIARNPRFTTIDVLDCVPYNGEILPDANPHKDLVSLVHSDEKYDPSLCDDCPTRFQCFPTLFKDPNALTGDELRELLRDTRVDPSPTDTDSKTKPGPGEEGQQFGPGADGKKG